MADTLPVDVFQDVVKYASCLGVSPSRHYENPPNRVVFIKRVDVLYTPFVYTFFTESSVTAHGA